MKDNGNYYLAAISSFVIWGFFSIPLKSLSAYPAGDILFFRIIFSLFVLLLVFLFLKREAFSEGIKMFKSFDLAQRYRFLFLTIAGGLLITVNWLVFIYIVNNVNIKTATFSYMICPVITAVLGFVILKEKLTAVQWGAVFLCAVSCAFIGYSSLKELAYSFFTGSTYALYLITQRKNTAFDKLLILFAQLICSLILFMPFYNLIVSSTPADIFFYGNILFIAVLFTILPLFLNLYALKGLKSATVGILMYANPLINFTVALFYFKETVNPLQITGYVVILLAIVLFNYENLIKAMRRTGSTV